MYRRTSTHVVGPELDPQAIPDHTPYKGVGLVWIGVDQVDLVPSDPEGGCNVPVLIGGQVHVVRITSTLSAQLTVSGAGGLDTGAEAADTLYALRVITKAGGVQPALLYTVDGDAPTLPAGYVGQSLPLHGVVNDDSSNILKFHQVGPGVFLQADSVTYMEGLLDGTQNGNVALEVDLEGLVPEDAEEILLWMRAEQTAANSQGVNLFTESAASRIPVSMTGLGDLAGASTHQSAQVRMPMSATPADSVWYSWGNGTVTGGCDLFVCGWVMKWQ